MEMKGVLLGRADGGTPGEEEKEEEEAEDSRARQRDPNANAKQIKALLRRNFIVSLVVYSSIYIFVL